MTATGGLTRLAGGYGLLEGARWYPEHGLVFSDMTGGGVFRLRAGSASPDTLIPYRKAIGGLVAHAGGGFVVSGRNVSVKAADGTATVLLEAAPDEQFFNDITADGRGRLFAGSVPRSDQSPGAAGRLYLIAEDGAVTVVADDVLISNGLGAGPGDRRLYHVDSGRGTVWRFALDAADIGGSREVFVSTSEYQALPDGLAVAADGSVWVALAGAGLVVGWDADGTRISEIGVPHALVTSVCFGGPGLSTLYILTGTNKEYPNADGGSVFAAVAPRTGLAAPVARVQRVQRLAGWTARLTSHQFGPLSCPFCRECATRTDGRWRREGWAVPEMSDLSAMSITGLSTSGPAVNFHTCRQVHAGAGLTGVGGEDRAVTPPVTRLVNDPAGQAQEHVTRGFAC